MLLFHIVHIMIQVCVHIVHIIQGRSYYSGAVCVHRRGAVCVWSAWSACGLRGLRVVCVVCVWSACIVAACVWSGLRVVWSASACVVCGACLRRGLRARSGGCGWKGAPLFMKQINS